MNPYTAVNHCDICGDVHRLINDEERERLSLTGVCDQCNEDLESQTRGRWIGAGLIILALAVLWAMSGCSRMRPEEEHGPVEPRNEMHETTSVKTGIEVLYLNDGTRCVVYSAASAGGVTCDWNRNQ